MTAIILGSAKIEDYAVIKNEPLFAEAAQDSGLLVIACDGGAEHAENLGLPLSMLVGDMDSIDAELLERYENSGVHIQKYKKEKDYTDTEIGLSEALAKGAETVIFIGVTGGRLDHTLGNIGLLYKCMKNGAKPFIIDGYGVVTIIRDKLTMDGMMGKTVSIIPYTKKVKKVTTFGLQYPLRGETLKISSSRGLSNVVTSDKSGVTIEGGVALVIINRLEGL